MGRDAASGRWEETFDIGLFEQILIVESFKINWMRFEATKKNS